MANLGMAFDANNVEPAQEMGPLPEGEYVVMVTESEMKQTRDGTGQMLALTLEAIEGDLNGRKLWDNLNLVNKSQQAMQIAQATLSSICRAIGVMQITDSNALHNRPMKVKVATESYTGQDGNQKQSSRIKAYKPVNEQAAAQPAPVQQQPAQQPIQQQTQAPATSDAGPWRNG